VRMSRKRLREAEYRRCRSELETAALDRVLGPLTARKTG
jgi:hypothetical protein